MTDFGDLHDELRAVARDVLSHGTPDWRRVVDAGWTGLEAPEDRGGSGASFVETAIVLEELGRAAADTRYLGSTLAMGVLAQLSPTDSRDDLLERLAAGETASVATGFIADGGVVSGRAEFVPDADGADHLLLVGGDAVMIATGVDVAPQPVVDETRRLAAVIADGSRIAQSWPLPDGGRVILQRAAVAVACDSLGLAEAMLARTVDYTSVRHQFGRPIGSFQAVKHACADMLVQIAVARQLVAAAAADLATGRDASTSSAMAKSYATSMAVDVVGKAMQLHGGIGYTWESGVHVYLKRATLNRSLYGSPAEHRRTLATRYG
ncbi:acyl-CoA dehydrogenase family protein [Mycolicibacterium sediminis]|uniref:Acyl-CoA dehydrogenase n=1 Tax=Mycolicibacterium sediminis TaxID=1286180 RepID=A0A7I7QXI5_9MYCO|nr:acyl-CoA dehydrogenase family protein [Mycolicibacterium sediminis]BBY31048.1 acyl-CoA dehydrogenase [Mycolicibacterium sediminis]